MWCEISDENDQQRIYTLVDTGLDITPSITEQYPSIGGEYGVAIKLLEGAVLKTELSVYDPLGKPHEHPLDPTEQIWFVKKGELRNWIAERHPNGKNEPLFPDVSLSVDKLTLENNSLRKEISKLKSELASLQRLEAATNEKNNTVSDKPNTKTLNAQLRLIGALFEIISGESKAMKPHPDFTSTRQILKFIEKQYQAPGLGYQSMNEKITEGKRIVNEVRP